MKTRRKFRLGSRYWGALAVAVIGAAAALGCASENEAPTVRVASQNLSALGSFKVLNATSKNGVALWATEWAEIGDRVKVLEGTAPGGISNSGTGVLRVGSDAKVGSIWAKGTVDLRDRANVTGAVFVSTASALSKGNQVTITSGVTAGNLGGTTDIFDEPPSYPLHGGDVRLEPGQFQVVKPGHYGELVVKPNSTVRLLPGDYSFSRVFIESGATVQTSEECAISRMRVREALFFRGKVQHTGSDGGMRLAIAYDGTQTAHVEQPFSGAILAHQAELVLSSHRHVGRFFAKRLRVQSDAQIVGSRPLQCESSTEEVVAPPVVPAVLGAAPPLQGPDDLDEFLSWFYRITPGELEEARAALAPVTNDAGVLLAVLVRFEQARTERSFGKALMLLELVGAMATPSAEAAMIQLLSEPVGFPPSEDDFETRYDDEVSYRRQAIFILGAKDSAAARAAVQNAAFNHTDRQVREAGIRVLAYGSTEQERNALKTQVQAGDEFFVDRPNRTDPDFQARYAQMQQNYTVQ